VLLRLLDPGDDPQWPAAGQHSSTFGFRIKENNSSSSQTRQFRQLLLDF